MASKVDVRLGEIQEALLIPLWPRAVELRQPSPILRDPKSVEMAQSVDYDFEKFAKAKSSQIGCCRRGLVFDGWMKRYLETHPLHLCRCAAAAPAAALPLLFPARAGALCPAVPSKYLPTGPH